MYRNPGADTMRKTLSFNIVNLANNLEREGVKKTLARCFVSIVAHHQKIGRVVKEAVEEAKIKGARIVEAEVIETKSCNDGKS